jgi:hypothetical protein
MPIDTATRKYQYREVVMVSGSSTKDQLFDKARQWFVSNYKDASEVLQVQDKESGTLVGKGIFTVNFQGGQRKVFHTVSIDCKDGKYRVTITDFMLKFSSVYTEKSFEMLTKNDFWGLDKLYAATDSKVLENLKSIALKMNSKPDEW